MSSELQESAAQGHLESKLSPSESTVYVANLPFSLTNNDLHQVFAKYGKVVKVTIVKDKETRKSKGVAFVLFLRNEDAVHCTSELNGQQMFGRTLKCSIAKDNGRTSEFIRKKQCPNKTRCYECGEFGHLSYECPKNLLGNRELPKKEARKKKRPKTKRRDGEDEDPGDLDEAGEEAEADSLSAAIQYQYSISQKDQEDTRTLASCVKKKKFKQSSYFSDEEDVSD